MLEALGHLLVAGICAILDMTTGPDRPINVSTPKGRGGHVPCKLCRTETLNPHWLCDACYGDYKAPELAEEAPEPIVVTREEYYYGEA